MKNSLLTLLTISSILVTPCLRAQEMMAPLAAVEETQPDTSVPTPDSAPSAEPESPSSTAIPTPEADAQPSTPTDAPTEDEEGTPVGQASSEGSKIAKKKTWQNVGLAIVSVAIAVTALILVSQNDGHGKHHHSH